MKMDCKNMGYLFQAKYGECYLKNNKSKDIHKHIVKELTQECYLKADFIKFNEIKGIYNFVAKILYPGAIIGIGNFGMADVGNENNSDLIKNGFNFDYVTGLPYIPGSSIKGILRNAMEKYEDSVKSFLKNYGINEDLDEKYKKIVCCLFGDNDGNTDSFRRDVFLDAHISKDNNGILKEDYITPHKEEFKNPIPIKILGINPEVEIKFNFLIEEKEICGLNSECRKNLYKGLLLDLGVGAKTNLGYGILEEI